VSVPLLSKSNLNQLTPCSRVLPDETTGPQLVNKFPAFYGTRRFITVLTRACHLSMSKSLLHILHCFHVTIHPTTGNNFPSVWHPSHTYWIILHTWTFDHVCNRPTIFKMTVQWNDTIIVSLHGCMTTKTIHKCPLQEDTEGCMKQLYMDMAIHIFLNSNVNLILKTCEILTNMQ